MMKRIMNGLSIVLSLLIFTSACEAKTRTKGKFHLVYLVSAVDLKKGSKVYVDPIFFTDGEKIIGFHEYCKRGKKLLNRKNITENWNVIQSYCANKNFVLNPRSYFITNNHGTIVKIDKIKFTSKLSVLNEPVMMGRSSLIRATSKYKADPKLLRKDGAPDYFFLMANNKYLLENIIPNVAINENNVKQLINRANRFMSRIRKNGIINKAGIYFKYNYDIEKRIEYRKDTIIVSTPRLENPIFTDIDSDGKVDLVVTMSVVVKKKNESSEPNYNWIGIWYILGNGKTLLGSNPLYESQGPSKKLGSSGGMYERFLKNGYSIMSPKVVIRIQKNNNSTCGYVVRYSTSSYMKTPRGIFLESPSCIDIIGLPKLKGAY